MIKLIKLIIVNLLSVTNLQRIKMAHEQNLRDPKETQIIIYSIFYFLLGYFVYFFANRYLINLKDIIPIIAYISCFFIILFLNIINTKDTIFSSEENEFLFSLPLKTSEIILSKLAIIYVKNILLVIVIMLPSYIVYSSVCTVSDITSLVYFLSCLLLPLIPIIISTIYTAIDTYYKNSHKKKKYIIIKLIIILLLLVGIFVLFSTANRNDVNEVINRTFYLNPMFYLYKVSILKNNFIIIILFIALQPYLLYLFSKYLSFNYNYIVSQLKGVKVLNNKKIEIKKPLNSVHSLIRKEIKTIWNNKVYFKNAISRGILFSVVFFIISIFINKELFKMDYSNTCLMILIVSIAASINCSTINSMSLEGDNIFNYKTLPIRFYKVLLSKWLTNLIIVFPLIIINALTVFIFYKTKPLVLLFLILNPLAQTMFVSLLGLVLDYKFINYKEHDDNIIINGRIIGYIPFIIQVIIVIIYLIITLFKMLNYYLVAYLLINLFFFILVLLYLIASYKSLYKNNL